MRKVSMVLAVLILAFAAAASAQTWHTANQVTVGWDMSDGSTVDPPIPQAQISYYVYLANAVTDPDKANPSRIGATAETTFQITLNTHGRYFVGVSSTNTVEGEVVGESDIIWSNVPADVAGGEPWGIQYFAPPPKPMELRLQ